MNPMVAIAVAQAGIQLYGMLRSKGGGIDGVLSAQTEMLAEISNQIVIINGKLDVVYKSLDELKGMVQKLPEQTAIAAQKLALEAHFINAWELLGTFSKHQQRWGRIKAVSMVENATGLLLNDLQIARSALISDKSEALCLIVAASWFIELQLMGNCIPFDPTRLAYAASTYNRAFTSWLTNDIEPTLKKMSSEVVEMRNAINDSSRYLDYECYNSIKATRTKKKGGGGGKEGNSFEWYEYNVTAKQPKLVATPSPVRERLKAYNDGLETLRTSGVSMDAAYTEIAPLQWNFSTRDYSFNANDREGGNAKQRYQKAVATLRQTECKESAGFAEEFAARENERADLTEKCFLRTLLYGHYYLVCREGQRSVSSILKRATESV